MATWLLFDYEIVFEFILNSISDKSSQNKEKQLTT